MLQAHFSALWHKLLCSEAPLVPFRVTHTSSRADVWSIKLVSAPVLYRQDALRFIDKLTARNRLQDVWFISVTFRPGQPADWSPSSSHWHAWDSALSRKLSGLIVSYIYTQTRSPVSLRLDHQMSKNVSLYWLLWPDADHWGYHRIYTPSRPLGSTFLTFILWFFCWSVLQENTHKEPNTLMHDAPLHHAAKVQTAKCTFCIELK